jgi:hypothetical protein
VTGQSRWPVTDANAGSATDTRRIARRNGQSSYRPAAAGPGRHARPPDPEALRGSFEFYRALGTTTAQNEQRKTRRLPLLVLAIGGEESGGEGVVATMKLVAFEHDLDNVSRAMREVRVDYLPSTDSRRAQRVAPDATLAAPMSQPSKRSYG